MRSFIIGTAGHVDHGKTELIRALTGVDTDRLQEEKKRGISIQLGYAPLVLSSDLTAGIVDVPGHEKFVKTMVMGATQINLVLFVIAANEGMKPQSFEHLEILSLLGIHKAIVVITKTDLVEKDSLKKNMIKLQKDLKGSFLEQSPLVMTSAVKAKGIETLKSEIKKISKDILCSISDKSQSDVRMHIDRSFTLKGFGTVVTGPLISGTIGIDQMLELYPAHKKVRVRQIHAYGKSCDKISAPSRVALNIKNISKDDISTGDVIGSPQAFKATRSIEAEVSFLRPLKSRQVLFYSGTSRALVGLKKKRNSKNYILKFDQPMTLFNGDKFILRLSTTLGGGRVVNSHIVKKIKPVVTVAKSNSNQIQIEANQLFEIIKQNALISSPFHFDSFDKVNVKPYKKVLSNLILENKIARIPQGFYLLSSQADALKQNLISHFKVKDILEVKDLKASLKISRKYAIPYLEFFDAMKWTLRKGSARVAWKILQN